MIVSSSDVVPSWVFLHNRPCGYRGVARDLKKCKKHQKKKSAISTTVKITFFGLEDNTKQKVLGALCTDKIPNSIIIV